MIESDSIESLRIMHLNLIPDLIILEVSQDSYDQNLDIIQTARRYYAKPGIIVYDENPHNIPGLIPSVNEIANYLSKGMKTTITAQLLGKQVSTSYA